jgi:hypothetical protein
MASHRADQVGFASVLPGDTDRKPRPASLPSPRLAVVIGLPTEPAPYVGEGFDSEKLESYPPGAVFVLPGGTRRFDSARSGEYVGGVSAIGPLGPEYLHPRDGPRNG